MRYISPTYSELIRRPPS